MPSLASSCHPKARIIRQPVAGGNDPADSLQDCGLETDPIRAHIAAMKALYALLAGGVAPLGFWLAKGSC